MPSAQLQEPFPPCSAPGPAGRSRLYIKLLARVLSSSGLALTDEQAVMLLGENPYLLFLLVLLVFPERHDLKQE